MFESLDHEIIKQVQAQVLQEHEHRLAELGESIKHYASGAGVDVLPGESFSSNGNPLMFPLEKMCKEYIAIEQSLANRRITDESE